MGWTGYTVYSKDDVYGEIEKLFDDRMKDGRDRFDIRAHAVYGSTHYVAAYDAYDDKVKAWIILTHYSQKNCELLYKDLSEFCGGEYRGVPLKLLDMLSETDNEYSLAWRKNARDWHARESWLKSRLQPGAVVKLNYGFDYGSGDEFEFKLVRGNRKRGFWFSLDNGMYGRPPRRWKENIVAVDGEKAPVVQGYF